MVLLSLEHAVHGVGAPLDRQHEALGEVGDAVERRPHELLHLGQFLFVVLEGPQDGHVLRRVPEAHGDLHGVACGAGPGGAGRGPVAEGCDGGGVMAPEPITPATASALLIA